MKRIKAAISIAIITLALVGSSVMVPVGALGAVETGGYPWADAALIRAATYDWGYTSCQSAMQAAKTCGAHVTTKLGRRYYESDPWHYDVRNCTSYVAWRINKETGLSIAGWGNANNWDNAAPRAGFTVDHTPAVGSIAAWESYYGHVAYVVAVNSDQSVNVEQYNKAGTGQFSRQSRVRADHYIHVRDQAPAAVVQAVVNSPAPATVSTLTPVTPAAATSAPTAPKVEPLAPLSPTQNALFPSRPGTSFIPALDTKAQEVSVYAIEYQNTNSGHLEISQSDTADGNTSWLNHWVTSMPIISAPQVKFLVADANADGYQDLYVITPASSTQQKVTVLSGSQGFQEQFGDWKTQAEPNQKDADYSLADYDGNGSLDLFEIHQDTTQTKITIMDGSDKFSKALAEWQAPNTSSQHQTFMVGDHDRDGKADVYALSDQVIVYGASSNYREPIRSWKIEPEPKSTPGKTKSSTS
jgi:surface antigen